MDKAYLLAQSNAICKNTLMETLGIEFVDLSEDSLTARMPVTSRVYQPDGVLHGGATIALAESVGSAAAFMLSNEERLQIRGIEISANHVKSVKEGYVYAHARYVHKGRTTQLWHIDIRDDDGNLVSFVKMTTLSLTK